MPPRTRFRRHLPLARNAAASLAVTLALLAQGPAMARTVAKAPAQTILVNARIATQDDARHEAEAMAIRDGKLIAVGTRAQAMAYRGPKTAVIDAGGRRVLPGLVDAHLHPPLGLYPIDVCDLDNKAHSLADLSAIVHDCIARYKPAKGEWLSVAQWNYADGNDLSPGYETIRAALDRAAPDNPVQLVGSDFHHGAYNSAALVLARQSDGTTVGLSAATLAGPFKSFATFVGVDAHGEPDGRVGETARALIPSPTLLGSVFQAVLREPERTVEALNGAGITAIQDAAVTIGENDRLYTELERRNHLTLRVNMLPLMGKDTIALGSTTLSVEDMVKAASAFRARFAADPLIRVTGVKVFVDGVLEANPLAVPPTMPNSPSLKPYLQPIFRTEAGKTAVVGYVDTDGPACHGWAAASDHGKAAASAFLAANGYHPDQCAKVSGAFVTGPPLLGRYVTAMHRAGFDVHLHAIGDGAVSAALDAVEAARADYPAFASRDAIAHLQIVSDRDIERLGRDHIFGVFTMSWAVHDPAADLDVVPFVENVLVNGKMDLNQPDSYYDRHAYPAKSMLKAGGIIAAGSDAPVASRNPIPFVNMAAALTRQMEGQPVLGPQERLTIAEELDAYTRNGARALRREDEIGSLEPGKSADFILIDQDIFALGAQGKGADIARTRVLETWFKGQRVFVAKPGAAS